MLKTAKGFTFVEALIGLNITIIIIFTLAVVIRPIYEERTILYERREASRILHDQLQSFLYNTHSLPHEQIERINHSKIKLTYKQKDEFVEACARWKNIKDRKEALCLYGISSNK